MKERLQENVSASGRFTTPRARPDALTRIFSIDEVDRTLPAHGVQRTVTLSRVERQSKQFRVGQGYH